MDALQRVNREGITPQVSRPDRAKVLAGDPVHTAWSVEERGSLCAGMWHSTEGKWRFDYAEWKNVHVLEGVSVLTDEAGRATTLRAGDSFVIRPGFRGTWEVVEPTLKDYVILA